MATLIRCPRCGWSYIVLEKNEPIARLYMGDHVRRNHGDETGHFEEKLHVDNIPLSNGVIINDAENNNIGFDGTFSD